MAIPEMLIDEPERVDERLWPGLCGFAQRLADVIRFLPASSPVLLSGDWGSGKTTLLHALHRAVSSGETPRPAVWFDAWRYEAEPALLSALMRAVWEAAPEAYRDRTEARSLFKDLWALAVVVGSRVLPVVASGVGASMLGAALKELTAKAISEDASVMAGIAGDPLSPEVDATSLLWERFARLVREAWGGEAPIVLIDDLDRCNPDTAVALLDGIRLLVTGGAELRCNFIVALDRGVLASAIGRKFAGINGYDGNRYLEKVFPIGFSVPAPYEGDADNLVAQFLGPAQADGIDTDARRSAIKAALRNPWFANPRLMKRCINRFRLVTYFESTMPSVVAPGAGRDAVGGDAARAKRDRDLVTWIAATERWPMLRPLLSRHDDAYWQAVSEAIQPLRNTSIASLDDRRTALRALPGPEVEALVKEQGALHWLRQEMFGETGRVTLYREAEGRLRRWGA